MYGQNTGGYYLRRLDGDTLVQIIEGEVAEDDKLSQAGQLPLES